MAQPADHRITSERHLELDESPGSRRPGRFRPNAVRRRGGQESHLAPAPGAKPRDSVKSQKFDQLAGSESDFNDMVIRFRDDDWPEDWDDNREEVFDENGLNLLHYSILKGYSTAVTVLLEDHEFDVNRQTEKSGRSPLILALQKCKEHLGDEKGAKPFHTIAAALVDLEAEVDESVMKLAVNFPKILVDVLRQNPEFYKPRGDGSSSLTRAMTGLHRSLDQIGFVELVLRKNADVIIKQLVTDNPEFLKKHTNTIGETPLHSAAKLGKIEITTLLMKTGGLAKYAAFDRNHYTPIISAMVYCDHADEGAVAAASGVIAAILAALPVESGIAAIQHQYRGVPVIEYDIKSGEGIIVQAILMLKSDLREEFLLGKYKLGNIFHIAARYDYPLQNFYVENEEEEVLRLEHFDCPVDPDARRAHLPCDYAVEQGHINFLHWVWQFGREDWSHEIDTACICGQLDVLLFLRSKTKFPPDDESNRKLLRLACQHGQASIVEFLLDTVNVSTDRSNSEKDEKLPSVLMLAADCNAADCVTLLLNHNASVLDIDDKGNNALCRAILIGKKKAVMAILTHPVHGDAALNFCTVTNKTPMRLLVKHMTDVAQWVLNNQIIRKSPNEIEYRYELIDDFDRYYCDFVGPLGYLHRHYGSHQPGATAINHSMSAEYFRVDGDSTDGNVQMSTRKSKPDKYEPKNHMLYLMVKSKSLDILNHKLVTNVINHYWRYVIWQWIVLRSVYLFITVMLTAFTLVLPHPNEDICKSSFSGISDGRRGFLIFASIILLLSSLLSLVISAYTIYIAKLGIISQRRFRVLFEAILPVLIFLYVIGYGNDEWCAQRWQWNVGAFCTCLSWLTLLETLKGFRLTAAPISMLFAIMKNFITIIYVPILLIAAFALPFYMLFTVPDQNFGSYQDIGSTLGTLAILLTGEGDYEGQFNSEDSVVRFPFASYFMYFLFVFMVGILFNNLLVSLAVGEVGDLQDNATLEQHRLNVEGIIDGLELFFPFISRKCPDPFVLDPNSDKNVAYFEAENELKKAEAENSEFADSILKDSPDEVIQSRIEHLEATLEEKIQVVEKNQELMFDKIEKLLAQRTDSGQS